MKKMPIQGYPLGGDHDMKYIRKYLVILVITTVIAGLFVPMNTQAQGEADKPTWEKGDEWSMGYKIDDLGEKFKPGLEQANNISMNVSEIQELDLSLDGRMGFFQIYKITGVSDTEYTMKIEAGGGLHVTGSMTLKSDELPKEGEYTASSIDQLPTTTKTIEADAELHYTMDITGTAHFTKDNLAMKDLSLDATYELEASFTAKNIPDTSTTHSGGYSTEDEITRNTTYRDFDISASGNVDLNLDMDFDPALDIFDFPISEGETWDIQSSMTISGEYSGEIDAQGLPKEVKRSLDAEGITPLPTNLEDIDTENQVVHDGKIEEQTVPVRMKGGCTGTEDVVLEDGSTTQAYKISYASGNSGDYADEYADGYDDGYYEGQYDASSNYSDYEPPGYPSDDDHYGRGYSNGYDDGYYGNEFDDSCPYEPGMQETPYSFKYSPDEGFFVSQQFNPPQGSSRFMEGTGFSMEPEEMMKTTDGDGFQMEPMSENEAKDDMDSMQQREDEDGKSLFDLLLTPPMLYVLIGIIGVVVVISVLVLKRRGGKEPRREYGPPPQQQQDYQNQEPGTQQETYQEYEDRGYRRTDQDPANQQPQNNQEQNRQF